MEVGVVGEAIRVENLQPCFSERLHIPLHMERRIWFPGKPGKRGGFSFHSAGPSPTPVPEMGRISYFTKARGKASHFTKQRGGASSYFTSHRGGSFKSEREKGWMTPSLCQTKAGFLVTYPKGAGLPVIPAEKDRSPECLKMVVFPFLPEERGRVFPLFERGIFPTSSYACKRWTFCSLGERGCTLVACPFLCQ